MVNPEKLRHEIITRRESSLDLDEEEPPAEGALGEEEEEQHTCAECEDQVAEVVCNSCIEHFCRPCADSLHRR
ncbi:unnamed protein product, partial [Chrysoparadoxa australica]